MNITAAAIALLFSSTLWTATEPDDQGTRLDILTKDQSIEIEAIRPAKPAEPWPSQQGASTVQLPSDRKEPVVNGSSTDTEPPTRLHMLGPGVSRFNCDDRLVCNVPSTGEMSDEGEAPETLPVAAQRVFYEMRIAPSLLDIRPRQGSGLRIVHKDIVGLTTDDPQSTSTVLLGTSVDVRAVPIQWVWDWQDGNPPQVVDEPSLNYPHHTVWGFYTRTGQYTVTVTTTWQGQYRIQGDAEWVTLPGYATTTSQETIQIGEKRTRLVQDLCYIPGVPDNRTNKQLAAVGCPPRQ